MTLFTRRAFVSVGVATVLASFKTSPANAQVLRGNTKLISAVIDFAKWSWPYLKEALFQEIAGQAAHYIIEHTEGFVQVAVKVTREGIERINAALKDATNEHLFQIVSAAVAAGVVLTIAISGPAGIFAVPLEFVLEAATLPILLVFYHDDVLNFVTGKAYELSYDF